VVGPGHAIGVPHRQSDLLHFPDSAHGIRIEPFANWGIRRAKARFIQRGQLVPVW
jgi:hypothetical protein